MANYYGQERTNYFKVKDVEKFKAWADQFGLEIIETKEQQEPFETLYGLLPDTSNDDDGCFSIWNEDDGERIEFIDELSKHLTEGEIAIVVGSGAEKLRYISGYATAVNHAGEQVGISINDIYAKAADFFGKPVDRITRAEY